MTANLMVQAMMERAMPQTWEGEDVFDLGNAGFEVPMRHWLRDSWEAEGHQI